MHSPIHYDHLVSGFRGARSAERRRAVVEFLDAVAATLRCGSPLEPCEVVAGFLRQAAAVRGRPVGSPDSFAVNARLLHATVLWREAGQHIYRLSDDRFELLARQDDPRLRSEDVNLPVTAIYVAFSDRCPLELWSGDHLLHPESLSNWRRLRGVYVYRDSTGIQLVMWGSDHRDSVDDDDAVAWVRCPNYGPLMTDVVEAVREVMAQSEGGNEATKARATIQLVAAARVTFNLLKYIHTEQASLKFSYSEGRVEWELS